MDDAGNGEYQDTDQIDLYHLPLITMGEAVGLRDVLWRERIDGYLDDPATRRAKALEDYEKIKVPVLHFGGWYDTFTRGSIAIWEGVKLYGGDADTSERQWLVMGPWDHESISMHLSGATVPTNIGRRDVGSKAVSTYGDGLLEFFTYFLKSISSTSMLRPSRISTQNEHWSQGSGVGPWAQLSAFANSRALVVLPTPRVPENKYACATRSNSMAFFRVRTMWSCPINSENF